MIRSAAPERRYAILAEGRFADSSAKTAHGLIRYGKDEVACRYGLDARGGARVPTSCLTSGVTRP